jgi:glycosyltransferase involved in cell wall biosynthesis
VPAFLEARKHIPELRMEIFGDGPDRPEVLRQVAEHGLEDVVDVPGFVPEERIDAALRRALCLVLPSRREGYGLVVLEAAARGVPSVVVAGDDNAAVELVEDGINGFVSASGAAADLGSCVAEVVRAGNRLRGSTRAWFTERCDRLTIESSVAAIADSYRRG